MSRRSGWKLEEVKGGKEGRRGQLELARPPSAASSPLLHQFWRAGSTRMRTRVVPVVNIWMRVEDK